MNSIDISVKVICLPIFARIIEHGGVASLLKYANEQLIPQLLPVPQHVFRSVNSLFAQQFTKLQHIVNGIVHECDYDHIPQLKYIEPKYTNVIEGPSPKCIASLLYGNKLNIKLTSSLVELCDYAVGNLDIINCSIVLIPTGTRLKPHLSEYCGVLTYILAVEGSTLLHMNIGSRSMTMTTKASVLYDPDASLTSVENSGPNMAILLKIDVCRPFDIGFDAVNWTVLELLNQSYEVQQACNHANM